MTDGDRPTWEDHRAGLEGEQLALAMLRGYLSDDEGDLSAVTDRCYELIQATAADPSVEGLADFESALAVIALRWGRELHGEGLDEHLAAKQAQLAVHIAGYEPGEPA